MSFMAASTTTEPIVSPAGLVIECDVAESIPAVRTARSGIQVLVLVRLFSEPIGMLAESLPADGLDPASLARIIVRDLGDELAERFAECGLPWTGEIPVSGLTPPGTPRFLATRERVMREGPQITAVICTRDRSAGLAKTLESLSAQQYQRMSVLVVDNAPTDDRTREVVREAQGAYPFDIDYVVEPRPGLSWARNRAIEESSGEVIAWVDDDERCDPWWAAEIARGYVEVPEADAVSGIIVPGELMTENQVLFENYSGVRRGRGFARAVFSPATASQQSPLYPLPPFGAGGNMSFRREALKLIGGFDCALGAGTLTQGGEDTAALSAVLLAGGTVVYQPTAIVHHFHRREYASLRRQLQGYGRGLTAFYLSVVLRRPACVAELVRLSGKSVREEFGAGDGQRLGEIGTDFPRELLRAHTIGLLQGPFAYLAAAVQARRLRRTVSGP
jgi:GT2 family glycosyltransferase